MNEPDLTKILLIDDHYIFNDGLRKLIDEQPNLKVCAQVFNARDALAAVHEFRPNLVLLDINLQGVNGIDIGREIVQSNSGVKVLVLTMYREAKLLEETRRAGLHGYILKESSTSELVKGINTVVRGGYCFILDAENVIENNTFKDDFVSRLNLTFREVEIIRLIRDGLNNEEIAEKLFVSIFTIKTHRKNIHFKLGLSNVAELIRFANKNGI